MELSHRLYRRLIGLPVTCDQPFTAFKDPIDFKVRPLAFSACGQYLVYRDYRVAGVRIFPLRDDSRMYFTDFLPKDDAWSYHSTFSTARGERDDDVASLFVTTTGLHGEVFVSQRDFVRGRDRRVVLAGLPKSLAPSLPARSATGIVVSQGSNQLQVIICKNFPAMQPTVLSFTNVPWTAWEEISGKVTLDIGDTRGGATADVKPNVAEEERRRASKRGRKRLAWEFQSYKTFMQDPKWLNIAAEYTEDADKSAQYYTYDDKGLPSSKLLNVISRRAPNQWSKEVGGRFEHLWSWKIAIPGSEPILGNWKAYVKQTSSERIGDFMSGSKMTPPFFTWDSWTGYRGTLSDLDALEEEE